MSQEKPKLKLNRKTRLWLYGIAIALAAVLVGYGIINTEQGDLWVSLIAAVLMVGPAVAIDNVPED